MSKMDPKRDIRYVKVRGERDPEELNEYQDTMDFADAAITDDLAEDEVCRRLIDITEIFDGKPRGYADESLKHVSHRKFGRN